LDLLPEVAAAGGPVLLHPVEVEGHEVPYGRGLR
jgi:hypothetical protein